MRNRTTGQRYACRRKINYRDQAFGSRYFFAGFNPSALI